MFLKNMPFLLYTNSKNFVIYLQEHIKKLEYIPFSRHALASSTVSCNLLRTLLVDIPPVRIVTISTGKYL